MTINSPKILVIDNSRAITGAVNAIRHATNQLRDKFTFVYVLPTGSTAKETLEIDGYEVYELPFVEISRRKADLLRYIPSLLINGWRVKKLAQKEGALVVHMNDFYNLTGYVAKLLSGGRLKVITHIRFLPQVLPQSLARIWGWLARHIATNVICVSEAVRSYFKISPQIQVIYDPLPGVERHPKLTNSIRTDSTVQLLYLSNYIEGKGQNFALTAFRIAYAINPSLRLRFVGGDMGLEKNRSFLQRLKDEVAQNHLQEVVTFDGFATDVENSIKQADILLNFSEAESFSLTCLDALFYGTPLIASDCGGPRELFEHNISGVLVANRDVSAMASAIVHLAADAVLRARFSAEGRVFVRQKFAPMYTSELLGKLYQKLTRLVN